jgi:hypothetical protein
MVLLLGGMMKRVLKVVAIAVALMLVFALLGWAMMPRWRARPYADHIDVSTSDPTIATQAASASGGNSPEGGGNSPGGRFRVRETHMNIDMGGGVRLPAILREPIDAPGHRPACLFIHGSGTGSAQDFGDIANAMASSGIVTLVPAKRIDDYTVLHRDYPRFAGDYSRSFDALRSVGGVDPEEAGIYAESEGTWIATILASWRQDIAFSILSSAPVFKGRDQMAMAASSYVHESGAPTPVVKDMAKVMSLDYAPFDLAYADFDANRYLHALTMPVLVNYGTYDTAMPIEEGAKRIIAAAGSVGNDNVTVRYFAANHQMRAGKGLFTANLPLADGYTHVLEDWVDGVAAGTDANGWATPRIAGVRPNQRFAAPQRTDSGIIGSLGVLAGVTAAGPVLMLIAALLGVVATVRSWLRSRSIARMRHGVVPSIGQWRYARRGRMASRAGSFAVRQHSRYGLAGSFVGVGVAVMAITLLLYGYMGAVGVAALFVRPFAQAFTVGWMVLQVLAVSVVVLFAWQLERVWRYRDSIIGIRRAIAVMVMMAALATLTVLAFWGLFTPWNL